MDKGLEALERIRQDINAYNDYRNDFEDLKVIEQAFLELQAIKNAEPSEALECLKNIEEIGKDCLDDCCDTWFNIIRQTLLKAQDQEKALNTTKEKNVNCQGLMACKTVEEYNESSNYFLHKLTQEEFDLLKRYLR